MSNNPILSLDNKAQTFFGSFGGGTTSPKYWHQIFIRVKPSAIETNALGISSGTVQSIIDYYSDDDTPIETIDSVKIILTDKRLHSFSYFLDGTQMDGDTTLDSGNIVAYLSYVSDNAVGSYYKVLCPSSTLTNYEVFDNVIEGNGETHTMMLYGIQQRLDVIGATGLTLYSPYKKDDFSNSKACGNLMYYLENACHYIGNGGGKNFLDASGKLLYQFSWQELQVGTNNMRSKVSGVKYDFSTNDYENISENVDFYNLGEFA